MKPTTRKSSCTLAGSLLLALLFAAATPPAALADGGAAVRTRSHGGSSGSRGGHYHSGHRGGRVGVGVFLGSGYYRPYSPYYYGYGWGPYPPAYYLGGGNPGVGAFDLNVKPKKAEVYVDGTYVGTAGKLDGFPSHLWVERGEHELVFYLPGYETVARLVTALPGSVVDLTFEMIPGESVEPEQVASRWPGQGGPESEAVADGASYASPDRARGEARSGDWRGRAPAEDLDARAEPGRLLVAVAPSDASVYLDGRFLGTGRELSGLHSGLIVDPGSHQIEVVRPGFESQSSDFTVVAGQEVAVEVNLQQL
jgi:PEGA domain